MTQRERVGGELTKSASSEKQRSLMVGSAKNWSFCLSDLSPVFDEDLDDDVGELDVHDGRHRLLLGPEQRRSEADAQVRDRHHVPLAVRRHLGEDGQKNCFRIVAL